MPRGDGTGPMGEGPMTGGGRGFCNVTSDNNPKSYPRYGLGLGRGRGYGRRFFTQNVTPRKDNTNE